MEPEQKILDTWSWNRNHSPSSTSNYCEPCPGLFYLLVFKAGCKLVSFSRMAFPPVYAHAKTIAEFITHVQYVVENIFRGKPQ